MSTPETIQRLNQEASEWMHRGMDLLPETAPAALEEAIRCFDRAIDLRRTLPLEENPFFRYGLSAGWLNRGDAFARLGGAPALNEAVRSYDEGLALLESLPLGENVLYPRRLAIARINRGVALQRQEPPRHREAAVAFRAVLEILDAPTAAAIDDLLLLRAGAWTNLAGALATSEEAFAAIRRALDATRPSERTDAAMAGAGLKARTMVCGLVVKEWADRPAIPETVVAEATDAVEEALALARHWKGRGEATFDAVARGIFCFGCWIYGKSLPRFLGEFLLEWLDLEHPNPEKTAAARAAIQSALKPLSEAGFDTEAKELRAIEERLQQLPSDRTPQ